jgi:hypothetical protein
MALHPDPARGQPAKHEGQLHDPAHEPAHPQPPQPHDPAHQDPALGRTEEPPPPPPAPAKTEAEIEALHTAQQAASIGAQVILDYNEAGSQGARGGAGATIEENSMARDAALVALGLDPVSPSGPPPSPEALKARQEAAANPAPAFVDPPPSGKATRVSSLAAGISSEDLPPPPDPPTVRGGAA